LNIFKSEEIAETYETKNRSGFEEGSFEVIASETMDINTNILHTNNVTASKSLSITKMVIIWSLMFYRAGLLIIIT
jgi:hypothetical protein